jgi:hypothetical protein
VAAAQVLVEQAGGWFAGLGFPASGALSLILA